MVHPRNRHTGCLLHRRNVNNGGICNRESRLVTRRSVNTSVQARLHCFELIYNSAKSITSLPNFAPSKLTGCWIQTLARREILEIIHLSHKVCWRCKTRLPTVPIIADLLYLCLCERPAHSQCHLRWVCFSASAFLILCGGTFIIDEHQRTCPWAPAGQLIPRSRLGLSLGPHWICLIFSGILLHDHITILRNFQRPPTMHACATAELGLLRLGAKPLCEVSPGQDNSAGLVTDILDPYKWYLWCDRFSDPAELALAR